MYLRDWIMFPYLRAYFQKASPLLKIILLIFCIIISSAGVYFSGIYHDKEKDAFNALWKIEPEYLSAKNLLRKYDSGIVEENIENHRQGLRDSTSRSMDEIDEIKNLYESGQIPYAFFEIRRNGKLKEIENSKEALADFIDNQVYLDSDNREILRAKNDELREKVDILKREKTIAYYLGCASFWGVFFGFIGVYLFAQNPWTCCVVMFLEFLIL